MAKYTTKNQLAKALKDTHRLVRWAENTPTRRNTLTLLRRAWRLHTSVVAMERRAC